MTATPPPTITQLADQYRAHAKGWHRRAILASHQPADAEAALALQADWAALADLCDDIAGAEHEPDIEAPLASAAQRLAARLPFAAWLLPRDTPQPATAPAEPTQDGPAGDHAPTGTPEGSGVVLGRALLDRHGDIWRESNGAYRAPDADEDFHRGYIEDHYGPVREVLLVSPEAGRVLEAAAEWQRRRAERGEPGSYSAEQYAEACAALESHLVWLRNLAPAHPVRAVAEHLDAMLAMVGDRPAEPAPEPGSGTGWNRQRIEELASGVRYGNHTGEAVRWRTADAANVLGLLAERDRLLAALAEANSDTKRARDQRDVAEERAEKAQAELERLRADHLLIPRGGIVGGKPLRPDTGCVLPRPTETRYLIGEMWLAGELIAVWTSQQPGITGPSNFQATHAHQAQSPPPDITDGWRYFWSQPGTQGDSE